MKDVQLPDNPALKSLLLDNHASYVEAFEKNKDDYVRMYITKHMHILFEICNSYKV